MQCKHTLISSQSAFCHLYLCLAGAKLILNTQGEEETATKLASALSALSFLLWGRRVHFWTFSFLQTVEFFCRERGNVFRGAALYTHFAPFVLYFSFHQSTIDNFYVDLLFRLCFYTCNSVQDMFLCQICSFASQLLSCFACFFFVLLYTREHFVSLVTVVELIWVKLFFLARFFQMWFNLYVFCCYTWYFAIYYLTDGLNLAKCIWWFCSCFFPRISSFTLCYICLCFLRVHSVLSNVFYFLFFTHMNLGKFVRHVLYVLL